MARIEVYEFLVDAFQYIFLDICKIKFRNFVGQKTKDRLQTMEISIGINPVIKITLYKVFYSISMKSLAIEYIPHFILIDIVIMAENLVGQYFS